jgi:cytidyltransferase-like protein
VVYIFAQLDLSLNSMLATQKIKSLDEAVRSLAPLRDAGKKIALCHGVFDLLHIGHLRHLTAAREFADVLIVTVTSDEFVNKGPGRPAFSDALRAEALSFVQT